MEPAIAQSSSPGPDAAPGSGAGRPAEPLGDGPRLAAAMATLAAVERAHRVERWTVDGVPVWPLVRVALGCSRAPAAPASSSAVPSTRRHARWRALAGHIGDEMAHARAVLGDWPARGSTRAHAPVVFLTHTTDRNLVGERWYDIFCDPIVDALGVASLSLEVVPGRDYRVPRRRPSVFLRPGRAALLRSLARRVTRPAPPALSGELAADWPACAALIREAGLGAFEPSLAQVADDAARVARMACGLERLLVRVGARVVVTVCYYVPEAMALVLAARRLGIPSVDLQHGTFEANPAYIAWGKVPPGGYATLPDAFWCWSEHDAARIEAWAGPARSRHRALVGGNLWLQRWAAGGGTDAAEIEGRFARAAGGARFHILYSTQPGVSLPDWIWAAVDAAGPDARLWLRAHPNALRSLDALEAQVPASARAKVDVVEASRLPLPFLLRRAAVHVTAFSTVVQEAADVGVPSIVVDPAGVDLFAATIAIEHATDAVSFAAALARVRAAGGARRDVALRSEGLEFLRAAVGARAAHGVVPATVSSESTGRPA